jgi:hypothetical protein
MISDKQSIYYLQFICKQCQPPKASNKLPVSSRFLALFLKSNPQGVGEVGGFFGGEFNLQTGCGLFPLWFFGGAKQFNRGYFYIVANGLNGNIGFGLCQRNSKQRVGFRGKADVLRGV